MFFAEPHLATRATLIREHMHNIGTHSNQPIITRSKCTLQMKRGRKLSTTRDTFLESPETLGPISGAIILFVSSKRWRLEARNYYEFIINFYSLDTYEKATFTKYRRVGALQNKRVGVPQMTFRVRNVFGTFEKRTPGYKIGKGKNKKKKC